MEVSKMVEEDVAGKIDTQYIREQLTYVDNVGILFLCTREGKAGDEDDWVDEDSGMRYLIIHLSYNVVRQLPDARPLMLQKAKERLGLVEGISLN